MKRTVSIVIAIVLIGGSGAFGEAPASKPTSVPSKPSTQRHTHKGHHHHGQTFVPFKSVKRYIAHLGKPARNKWQKPDKVVAALRLRRGDTIADIGAGGGYFAFRFAKVVSRGVVYAVEIEPKMLRHIETRARKLKVRNIRSVRSTSDDPKLPVPVDVAFMCNVLHHVGKPTQFLAKMAKMIKPGGRFVLIEFLKKPTPVGPPPHLKLSREKQIRMASRAGLVFHREISGILPYQRILVFRRPR